MTTLHPRYALCGRCESTMPVYMIGSFSTGGPWHTDFYEEDLGTQVVCYVLSVCPKCLFVGPTKEFKLIDQTQVVTESKLPFEELEELQRQYPPARRYIMLAERLAKEGASKVTIGNCYLDASRAERMTETEGQRSLDSKGLEKQCQIKCLKYFAEALDAGEMEGIPEHFYLMGELFRRAEDFLSAQQFFGKAKLALQKEKYFCIFLEDPGPDRKAISKKVREVTPINRKQSFALIDNVPSKVSGNLTFGDAAKQVSDFHSLGARTTIKEETELPAQRRKLLDLINAMEELAALKDGSDQVIETRGHRIVLC